MTFWYAHVPEAFGQDKRVSRVKKKMRCRTAHFLPHWLSFFATWRAFAPLISTFFSVLITVCLPDNTCGSYTALGCTYCAAASYNGCAWCAWNSTCVAAATAQCSGGTTTTCTAVGVCVCVFLCAFLVYSWVGVRLCVGCVFLHCWIICLLFAFVPFCFQMFYFVDFWRFHFFSKLQRVGYFGWP